MLIESGALCDVLGELEAPTPQRPGEARGHHDIGHLRSRLSWGLWWWCSATCKSLFLCLVPRLAFAGLIQKHEEQEATECEHSIFIHHADRDPSSVILASSKAILQFAQVSIDFLW